MFILFFLLFPLIISSQILKYLIHFVMFLQTGIFLLLMIQFSLEIIHIMKNQVRIIGNDYQLIGMILILLELIVVFESDLKHYLQIHLCYLFYLFSNQWINYSIIKINRMIKSSTSSLSFIILGNSILFFVLV